MKVLSCLPLSSLTQLARSPECSDCKVFATDAILATLMTMTRSKYSWDIVVHVSRVQEYN